MTGIALIAMGAYIQIAMSNYLNFMDNAYLNSSVLFIIIGCIILIVGFFGCCGACTESYCMMYTFAILLAFVILVEIGLAIAVFIFKGEAKGIISGKMVDGLKHYTLEEESPYKGVSETWAYIQKDFGCCGVSNYTNWKMADSMEDANIPDACCIDTEPGCGQGMLLANANLENINQDGCVLLLETAVLKNISTVLGVAVAIVVLQLLGVLVACMLAGNMKRRANYV